MIYLSDKAQKDDLKTLAEESRRSVSNYVVKLIDDAIKAGKSKSSKIAGNKPVED